MLRPRLLDVVLAVGCVVAAQVELRVRVGDGITAGPQWLNTLLLLVFGLLVAGWRVAPGPTLVAMAATMLLPSLVLAHDAYFWTTILPLLLVVFRSARSGDGPIARWGWTLAVVALFSDAVRETDAISSLVTTVVLFGGSSLTGRLVRRNEQQRDRLDRALTELGAAQTVREQAAAQAERNRIATEMHDVVAHAVSEMVLQIGAARMGLQTAHLAVPGQLAAAETTGRQALTDLRHSLGMRADHPRHGLAPVPGLAEVDALVAGFREAGLLVAVNRRGPCLTRLPTGLQLSVHRVLQEALTNALKHAGPVRVDVDLGSAGDHVCLDVVNDPPGRRDETLPSGHLGLVGMRERVSVYGGALVTGPTLSGGWRVHARWPLPAGVLA